ncbi:MAG TPA: AAA family ATPase [Candidatus Limnocylindria bacterium]|nr:AAA family ATPase [Candidatus Limnocylindria bacterium]
MAVIGSGGSGKLAFARELGERTALPVIHLDRLYWKPGWAEMPEDEWQEVHADLLEPERWIIDGNYGSTMESRLVVADTVIFLDLPRLVCFWRALRRHWRHRAGGRPDMVAGLRERIDARFLLWILRYPETHRPVVLARPAKLPATTQVIRIRSRREARQVLDSLAPAGGAG